MNYTVQSFDYFFYNGVRYAKGTEIELTDYAYSQYGIKSNEKPCVIFMRQNENSKELYCLIKGFSCIAIPNNHHYIKCIVKPIYYQNQPAIESAYNNYVTKKKTPDVFNGWLWFIFIMMFLVICKNGFLYMIIATIFFVCWLINKYKD